jgi:hypothetical protein
MKKLLLILLLATLIGCEKEPEPITECKCWDINVLYYIETSTGFDITLHYSSHCSDYTFTEIVNEVKYWGGYCFDEPIKYK